MGYGRGVKCSARIGSLGCALAGLALAGCSASSATTGKTCALAPFDADAGSFVLPDLDGGILGGARILLYTYSTGYRHDSIPDGIHALRALLEGAGLGVDVEGTEADARGAYCGNQPRPAAADRFTPGGLARYAAVLFLSTTSVVGRPLLDDAGGAALEAYVRGGGGFVGVHAAADAEYDWPFYGELVGARFVAHGPPVTASLRVEDAAHPATRHLPDPWPRFDEWFDFAPNPRATARVLVRLDEATYPDNPAPMGDHPIAWCKTVGAGRSFYTGLGHHAGAFGDAVVLRHLLGAILYAAGLLAADCSVVAPI